MPRLTVCRVFQFLWQEKGGHGKNHSETMMHLIQYQDPEQQ